MIKQLPVLTSLRGIAAIFIMLHHITIFFLAEIGKNVGQYTPFLEKCYLWVDFFFILSGFILCHVYQNNFSKNFGYRNFRRYIVARFARIYPLHIIILFGFVILELAKLYNYHLIQPSLAVTYQAFDDQHSLKTLFTNILLLQSLHQYSSWNEPAWAISAEWLLYFFIPFIIFFTKQKNLLINSIVFILAYVTLFIMTHFLGTLDVMSWKALLRCTTEVIIGITSYRFYFTYQTSKLIKSYYLTCALLVLLFLSLLIPVDHSLTVLILPALIINAAVTEEGMLAKNNLMLLLGKMSYSIYMIHWFVLEILEYIILFNSEVVLKQLHNLTYLIGFTLIVILLVLLISFICYKFVETPLRQYIKIKF
jgi:peptidoglycan/LPS O-acetylase OafA/YrhL